MRFILGYLEAVSYKNLTLPTNTMEVISVGFIIGVLQDSAETALNSSSDVLFTAAACMRAERIAVEEDRHGRDVRELR